MAKGRKTKRARTPEEEVFHVEVVKKARVVPAIDESTDDEKDGNKKKRKDKQKNTQSTHAPAKWEYFVKWAGYDEEANSWEPEENLEACSRLLGSFWEHVGMDNRDYQIGYEVKAKKDWIEKEKAFFAKEILTAQEELKRQEKAGNRSPKKKKKKVKHTPSEEPPSAESSKKTSVVSQPPPPPLEPGSSSEEEVPLSSLKIKIPAGSQTKRKRVVSSSSSEDQPLQSSQHHRSKKIPKFNEPSTKAAKATTSPPDSPTSLFSQPSSPNIPTTRIPVQEPTTGSVTNKPLTPSIPPTTVIRQRNPHSKIANMSSAVPLAASGISTKQRLAQGALAPTAPKEVGKVPLKPKPPLPTRKSSTNLNNLSFKKNKHPLSLTVPSTTLDQTDTLPSTFRSPMNETIFPSLNSPPLHSPQPTSALLSFAEPTSSTIVPALPGPSILRRRPSVLEPTIFPAVLTQSPSMTEVNQFLNSLMPEKLAAPLEPAVERPLEPVPPKPIHARVPLPGRILKMWKWTGPLFYKSGENPLCKVMMHVPRDAPQGVGLKFSIIFQGLEKIEVNYMYDYSDIRSIVPAFRKPPQLALIGPGGDEDVSKFRVIFHYMEKQQRVFVVPIHLDNNIIGYTVFFPYSLGLGLFGARPPSEYSDPGTLVVAILPFALSQEQIKLAPQAPETQLYPPLQQGPRPRSRPVVNHPRFHRATKILGFPEVLYKFLSDKAFVRAFAVWPDPDSKSSSTKGRQSLETKLLLNILERGQRNASSKSDVRVAFIHIGSLHQIHKFPEFAERRTKTFLQFYTYGTHYDVPPHMWAVKEIYPCGGIITFTPAAMHRDPVKVRQLIIQVGRHPLWECYILPASLGLLAQMECGTDDPLLRLERKQLMMEGILQSIEDGEVALMQAPPEKPIVTQQKDERANWVSQHVSICPPKKKQALQTGIMAFVQNPGLGRSKDMIEKVIVKDLSMMQRHPALMTSYRRFVVINLEAEGSRCGEFYEGFEWTSASKFDFRDDFYPKQTVGMH